MIITEQIELNSKQYTRTYSDAGVFIRNAETGEGDYEEAIDPIEITRTYVETDAPINAEDELSESEAYEIAGRILMGANDEQ